MVVLLGPNLRTTAGDHGPPGHDIVRPPQRPTPQGIVDAPANLVGPVGFCGEQHPDLHQIADAFSAGVVRRQRTGWLVIPVTAQRDRDRPAGGAEVAVAVHDELGLMSKGLAHTASVAAP